MVVLELPPFPVDVPAHPLPVIDYELIRAHDKSEIDRLWEAGTQLGFWYLKNHGADREVDEMFEMGQEAMAIPMEEKLKFDQGDDGISFGFKAVDDNAIYDKRTVNRAEFLDVAKDDALSWPTPARKIYHSTVNNRMDSTIAPFIMKSMQVHNTLFNVFDEYLGLSIGTLANMHTLDEYSGSVARIIHIPPIPPQDGNSLAIPGHKDFGSLSILFNRLGGLQYLDPGSESWQYVKPIPGHAICNVGDALSIFSGGVLRSNLHRVVPPPGEQRRLTRWSLVYFTRPGHSVVLRPLGEESPYIAEAVARSPNKNFETGLTAFEWHWKTLKNYKTKTFKGPISWKASH